MVQPTQKMGRVPGKPKPRCQPPTRLPNAVALCFGLSDDRLPTGTSPISRWFMDLPTTNASCPVTCLMRIADVTHLPECPSFCHPICRVHLDPKRVDADFTNHFRIGHHADIQGICFMEYELLGSLVPNIFILKTIFIIPCSGVSYWIIPPYYTVLLYRLIIPCSGNIFHGVIMIFFSTEWDPRRLKIWENFWLPKWPSWWEIYGKLVGGTGCYPIRRDPFNG